MTPKSPRPISYEPKRDANGRWVKGQSGNAHRGRAPHQKEVLYLTTIQTCVTIDDWIDVIHTALDQAKEGNWRAREWLSRYICPDPEPVQHGQPATIQIAYVNNWRTPQAELEEGEAIEGISAPVEQELSAS